jgi:hypothetical protein
MAAKFNSFGAEVDRQRVIALRECATIVENAVLLASGKYATRPITRMKATFNTLAGDPTVLVQMVSRKAHLLDHDTKAHEISPGALTGRRTKSPVLANVVKGFGPVRTTVHHPGTKGKLMWEKGIEVAVPAVTNRINDSLGAALLNTFR